MPRKSTDPAEDGGFAPPSFAELWWLPVGAGGRVVARSSRLWERGRALRDHRAPRPLFHAALEIQEQGRRTLIEMAPAWGPHAGAHGVVATGPVGARPLGRSRFFRYEIRCWEDGILPDREYAPEPPVRIPLTPGDARAALEHLRTAPRYTWGRDPLDAGEMWNSNSLIAWLLQVIDAGPADLHPPSGGLAPGWSAGIAAAQLR